MTEESRKNSFEKEKQVLVDLCKIGDTLACSRLVDTVHMKILYAKQFEEFKDRRTRLNTMRQGEIEVRKIQKEHCPLALEIIEEEFDGLLRETITSNSPRLKDKRDDFTWNVDVIEENCLKFPLIDCIEAKDIEPAQKFLHKEIFTRKDQDKLKACMVVMPGQDSQVIFFGKSDSVVAKVMEDVSELDTESANKALKEQATQWHEFLKKAPALQSNQDKQLGSISIEKVNEIIEKTGNFKRTVLDNMLMLDCVHPAAMIDKKAYYTRDILREKNLKMPALQRLETLKQNFFVWWLSDFNRKDLEQWNYPDMANIHKFVNDIDLYFPSERSMVDYYNTTIEKIGLLDNKWFDLMSHYLYSYYDKKKDVFIYVRFEQSSECKNCLVHGEIPSKRIFDLFIEKYHEQAKTENYIFPSIVNMLKSAILYARENERNLTPMGESYRYEGDQTSAMSNMMTNLTGKSYFTQGVSYKISEMMETFKITETKAITLITDMNFIKNEIDRNVMTGIDSLMKFIKESIGGYSVEHIEEEQHFIDSYWQRTIALYVSLGDTYDTTIVYNTEDNEFEITSWGDWFETWSAEHSEYYDGIND